MLRGLWLGVMCCAALVCSARGASAKVLRVPKQFPTIQAAVDAASNGDTIRVAPGAYCGATITKRVTLEGQGRPHIVGCVDGPAVFAGGRVGFFLPGTARLNPANGTEISGFYFDGEGVSSANLAPLSFGIFARFAQDIVVSDNHFEGTAQAITSTAGDRWRIEHNRIHGLTVLDCTGPCTGGDGIVIGLARGSLAGPGGDSASLNRPEDNLILHNTIEGTAPDGFEDFSMVGVLLLSADHTTVLRNELRMKDNPAADSVGQGILVSNECCGSATQYLPGSRNTVLAFNDGRKSEIGIVIDGTGGANTQGLFLFRNRGLQQIEDGPKVLVRAHKSPRHGHMRPRL